ncbi:V-type ATP synthase subunit I domain-containing protein [Candidatus Cetobacterium colombiensis]|uniref:Uncharacterized protein n=1 Tax=Candidatus Cetobacterium colombiensis TaxID=3073100 RepID=A0ABU4W6R8_9FUSO|nr:hypothetical protein [Candidatus Cetobacterium colombiensis]MDX8335222.1 hypothetical protein [Candidatus Cetobacterium colombiensis]
MKILKELFRDKKLEEELKQELKETKEKYEFLKIEFTKLLKSENNLRTELEKNQEKFSKEIRILSKEKDELKEKSLRKEIELRNEFIKEDKLRENAQKLKLAAEELEEKYYEEKKEQEIILKELNNLKESFKKEVLNKETLELKNKELEIAVESLNKECSEEKIEKQRILEDFNKKVDELENSFEKIRILSKEKVNLEKNIIKLEKLNFDLENYFDKKNEKILNENKFLNENLLKNKKIIAYYNDYIKEFENTEAIFDLEDKVVELEQKLFEAIKEKKELENELKNKKEMKISFKQQTIELNDLKKDSILPKEKKDDKNRLVLVGNWISYEEYMKNKNNLINLLKKFTHKDFKEIYLEGKKRKIMNSSYEKEFTNLLARFHLKLSINEIDLKKIELFYKKLMNEIHKNKNINNLNTIKFEKNTFKEEKELLIDKSVADILF